MQGVRVPEMRTGARQELCDFLPGAKRVLQEEQQLLWSPVLGGLVCNVVWETGMWFWLEALAMFRPLDLIIQMRWM